MTKNATLLERSTTLLKWVTLGVATFEAYRRVREALRTMRHAAQGRDAANGEPASDDAAVAATTPAVSNGRAEDAAAIRREFLERALTPRQARKGTAEHARGLRGKLLNFRPVMRGTRMIGKA